MASNIIIAEVPVTPMSFPRAPSSNSPLLAADPTDPRFVVMANRLDAPDFSCGLQMLGRSGRGWVSADPVPKLPQGAEKCYAPEVAFDGKGKLYYLFVGLQGRGNQPMGTYITTSNDRGQTFSPPRRVLGPLSFGLRMAIDRHKGPNGRIHLVWLKATSDPPLGGFGPPPNPILSAHSDDGGRSFSSPVQVSGTARERVVAPSLTLGAGGKVHVGYYDLREDARDYHGLEGGVYEGKWSLVFATSSDGGLTFGNGAVIDDQIVPSERVMLIFTMPPAALSSGGKSQICATWEDARYGDGDALMRCSQDRGESWGNLVRLNNDRRGNGKTQKLPRISIAPSGRIDAIFLDRRNDPENLRYETYLASTDSGNNRVRNLRISRHSFDSRIGQQYANVAAAGQYEFGSRLGLLSDDRRLIAAWPDSRNYDQATTGQDLFAAHVFFGDLKEPKVWPVDGSGIVGLILLGASVFLMRRLRGRREKLATGQES